jgi:alanyl-tRNA synthetase
VPGKGTHMKMASTSTKEKFWSGNEIREKFLQFFEGKKGPDGKGHRRVRSSSLVPHGDPTLLFTNAGMNQFKDVFLGLEKRDYTRATSAQKCVRAGGKHNDLENVGFTKRHHTFFEMLGNFSFGDYYKEYAITYAWELLTSDKWFNLDVNKLYFTIFGGAELTPGVNVGLDSLSRNTWVKVGAPQERVIALEGSQGIKELFWTMGETGPCGSCSEIHYDMGPAASDEGHADCKFPCDCGRYVEIWNLVFMQWNRDASGNLTPLPKPSVDTGMGLERIAAVLQGVISNYETDLFTPLIESAEKICSSTLSSQPDLAASFRIIADHSRAATFLISDDIVPSNEGRGYVLRKIIRRALRHSLIVGAPSPFLSKMSDAVRALMAGAYPELMGTADRVNHILDEEETRFSRTVNVGLKKLEEDLNELRGPSLIEHHARGQLRGTPFPVGQYSGEKAFKLYDTYGLPRDFIQDVVRDAAFSVDWDGFERAMQAQRVKARSSWKGGAKEAANPAYAKLAETFKTEPCFYFGTTAKDSRIEAIITKNGSVNELKPGESGEVVLDRTAIYAESGGQVADTGAFYDKSESQLLAEVKGAFYPVAGLVAHKVVAKETLCVGDRVTVVADAERHARIIRNHTGTHLVNAALRNILGTHVKQSGSLNAPERLRFDFSHFAHVDAEELRDIEQQVNDEIRLNTQIETNVTSLEEALASGALAFFGDKYPEQNVRVVTIPDPRAARGFYSKELCGGTHVQRVGDIGVLKIVSEESVAAGVRRIEAVTGIGALEHYQRALETLRGVAQLLNVGDENILMRINELAEKTAALEKDLGAAKRLRALLQIGELDTLIRESREKVSSEALVRGNSTVQLIKGTKVAWSQVQDVDKEQLREIMDKLRQEIRSGVVVLASVQDGGVSLIAGVTKDLTAKVHAGKLMQALAPMVGGKGGGRPDLAEAGGKDTTGLKLALESVPSLIEGLV